MRNDNHNSTAFNESIKSTTALFDVYKCVYTVVLAFGIAGNVLVIMSISRKRSLLKNNHYFLVLQLSICDLGCLLVYFINNLNLNFADTPLFNFSLLPCLEKSADVFCTFAGISMMLIISVLRHSAVVHPFQPEVIRRKLSIGCALVYIVGLTVGYGASIPPCFMEKNVQNAYVRLASACLVFLFYFFPILFMSVVYVKICRALSKQKKNLKRVCSKSSRRNSVYSLKVLRHMQNRRTFLICLSTVLCYGIGSLPLSAFFMWNFAALYYKLATRVWIRYVAEIIRVAGTNSANPLIYGILDKKLLSFWKPRREREAKRSGPVPSNENLENETVL